MGLLTDHELDMYRTRFLCSLDKLAKGLIDNPVSSDEVYRLAAINGFPGGLQTTDSLVQDVVILEYVKLGTGREIMLTIKGLQWCKENCE
ncbi:MAG: hypothetical protein GEU26_17770 [Nitrososphaeraceae archaeon]|nr:hypothetical protein [Nitrososphaeraceae archaeon]